jgi:hypothetical protein
MTDSSSDTPTPDPVLARRAKVARLCQLGQRIGYTLFGVFLVLIVIGLFTGFPDALATLATICLIVGSVALAPAITLSYAVKAADRADAEDDWR